jgi:hypothetical protein
MWLASALALVVAAGPELDLSTARFTDITGQLAENGRARSREIAEAWVGLHPTDPDAGRALIWIAHLYLADHQPDAAQPYFRRAAREYPKTQWGDYGTRGLADSDLAHHRFTEAIRGYESLEGSANPEIDYLGRMGAAEARGGRIRFIFFVAGLALLGGVFASRLWLARLAGGRLLRVPNELLYVLPVFVIMIIAAFHQEIDEGRTVIVLAVSSMFLLWANGVYLQARPPQRMRRPMEALLALVQAAALMYCSIIVTDVWHKFYDTLLSGPE